jgi:cob(I)alamin adenosyltransferase
MKIYTRTGDKGTTGLFGGDRVPKHHDRIEAYGTVDETNAFVGIARAGIGGRAALSELDSQLDRIQHHLFTLGADLATPSNSRARTDRVVEEQVGWLEERIDVLEADLEPLRNFILPGGDPVAAALHGARTVCRRAERRVSRLAGFEDVSRVALVYLNRLSDYLFVASRWANSRAGIPEHIWKGGDEA